MGPRIVVQENDAFSELPTPFFCGSTSKTYWAFHNKPLTLLWSLVPSIPSTKFPYGPRIRTSQLGAAMVVSMFHQYLLLCYAVKMYESRRSAMINVTCYCWACALAVWQRVSFYQPVGGWFWNCPCNTVSYRIPVWNFWLEVASSHFNLLLSGNEVLLFDPFAYVWN